MPEPTVAPAANEVKEDESLLGGENKAEASGAAPAAAKTAEEITAEKEAQAAEEKRILEADPATLNDAEKTKRTELESAKEEKRLLDTPKDQLSAEDQVKQAALLKAKEDARKLAQGKGAPEAYTDFTVPDGMKVNQPMLEEFKTIAKELDLSQEKAQRLIDLQVKHIQSFQDGLVETFNQTKKEWKEATIAALKEAGIVDYQKELIFASKAIERFGTPDLRKFLNQTGVGNQKEMVNFFLKVGKAISEDKLIDGKNKTGEKSDGALFYGDSMK
jgi:hypothetical protein